VGRIDQLLGRARAAARAGDLNTANRLVINALYLDPSRADCWALRARIAPDSVLAKQAWEQAVTLDGNYRVIPSPAGSGGRQEWSAAVSTGSKVRERGRAIRMIAFVAGRCLLGLIILVGVIFLTYLGLDMARGDPFLRAAINSVWSTTSYIARLTHGSLGLSPAGALSQLSRPTAWIVSQTLPRTLGLLALSLLFSACIGVPLGVVAASRRNDAGGLALVIFSVAGMSLPSFFTALLLQLLIIRFVRVFGVAIIPVGGFGWDAHIILPALVLAARPIAQTARITYVKVRGILDEDYIRTAYSKGLPWRRVLMRHAMRNAAIPILTTLTVSLRFSLSSLPIVEYFFAWPGAGFILLKTIAKQDDNTTIALLICLGALFAVVNSVVEMIYRYIDPRLRGHLVDTESTNGETGKTIGARLDSAREAILAMVHCDLLAHTRALLHALLDWFINDPLVRWIARQAHGIRQGRYSLSSMSGCARDRPRRASMRDGRKGNNAAFGRDARGSALRRLRATVNLPLVLGALLVAALIVVVIFGSYMAPHSPYTTHGLEKINGQYRAPPFAPSSEYPLGTDLIGRDILSLILVGAQQTLLLAAFAVTARVVVGIVLGAVSGWLHGTIVDKVILGVSSIIAAFPGLLAAMILILAIGIRQGFRPFVIALCLVGWGEIAQFVRSEILALRRRPFIESAVAVGASTPRVVLRHIIPHMIPALIPIVVLEMGAVLVLLGELGFLNIFIGGGTYFELQLTVPPYHFSDIPEWGSLLSSFRTYARSYPWVAIYPALAFFVSALGFNLFGIGLRSLAEKGRLRLRWLFSRYSAMAVLALVIVSSFVHTGTSPIYGYRQFAAGFDGAKAQEYIASLVAPDMHGRSLGSDGVRLAADYIAEQFDSLGVFRGGQDYTFFDVHACSFFQLDDQPQLAIDDGQGEIHYHQDYVEYAGRYQTIGEAAGKALFLATGILTTDMWSHYRALESLNLADRIVVVPSEREIQYLEHARIPVGAVLIVADSGRDMRKLVTISDDISVLHEGDTPMDFPKLWVTRAVADRILSGTGKTVRQLRAAAADLDNEQILVEETDVIARVAVHGTAHTDFPVRNVIGYIPGTISGDRMSHAGVALANHVVLVMAQYDSPASIASEGDYETANDNASGVAVMLEAIRILQHSGYQPFETIIFAAYSGEGYKNGHFNPDPDPSDMLQAAPGFSTGFTLDAVIRLRGVGIPSGRLSLNAGGNLRLMNVCKEAARQFGVATRTVDDAVDIGSIYGGENVAGSGQKAPEITISWDGWGETAHTEQDSLAAISARQLKRAGQAVTLALMALARDTSSAPVETPKFTSPTPP